MITGINNDKSKFDVLVIEDEEVVRLSVVRILNEENFSVDTAKDAETAFEKISGNSYRLIITDLMLPGISGMEFIKKQKETRIEIPIIMITGCATLENAIKSIQCGAYDFLPKPFSYEELAGIASRALFLPKVPTQLNSFVMNEDKPFNTSAIKKIFTMGIHSWVKVYTDNSFLVGAGQSFMETIDDIESVKLPEIGIDIYQGNSMAQLFTKKGFIHTVWTPLSGRVIGCNSEILKKPENFVHSPLEEGWLLKIIPTNYDYEIKNLSEYK
jgi:CheY-like chemotaxis protein